MNWKAHVACNFNYLFNVPLTLLYGSDIFFNCKKADIGNFIQKRPVDVHI